MTAAQRQLLQDIADRWVMQDSEGRAVHARTGRVIDHRIAVLEEAGLVVLSHALYVLTDAGHAALDEDR